MTGAQDNFRAALLNGELAVPCGLSDGQNRPAGRRFDVYRNNVAASLIEAMNVAFPVVAKLLGTKNMNALAGIFLRAHPPDTPLMMHYGAAFPEFLAGMEQLSHLGYLPDVARLELGIRRSYHAADANPIDPAQLAGLAPDVLMATRLGLAPSAILLRSDWPVYDIWAFNSRPDAPKPQARAQDVLVTRADFDPEPRLLLPGGARWIDCISQGHDLAAAQDAALAEAPDFDLGATLARLLEDRAIVSLNPKD